MSDLKTIGDEQFNIEKEDFDFEYQKSLTPYLDNFDEEFDQDHINKIVLWKVNRYAGVPDKVLEKLNEINSNDKHIDKDLTKRVLISMLKVKGIGLPMASTILRFKNPNVYQIIDQRVYRVLYKDEIKLSAYLSEKRIEEYVLLYIKYLNDLRNACGKLSIPFEEADRILYNADKRLNKAIKLNNY